MGAVFRGGITGIVIVEGVRIGIGQCFCTLLEHFLNLCPEVCRICLDLCKLLAGEVIQLLESGNAVKVAAVLYPFQSNLHYAGHRLDGGG